MILLIRFNKLQTDQIGERKMKKFASINYHKDYNGREGYTVEIMDSKGEWGLDSFFPLVEMKSEIPQTKNFIHFSILKKISELQQLGYTVMFM